MYMVKRHQETLGITMNLKEIDELVILIPKLQLNIMNMNFQLLSLEDKGLSIVPPLDFHRSMLSSPPSAVGEEKPNTNIDIDLGRILL